MNYLQASKLDPEFASVVVESMKANSLVRTPEGVAVWLAVRSHYPDAALPKNVWKHRDPLCRDEAVSLSDVMKDARAKRQPDSEDATTPQGSGVWSQQLHFSWDILLDELYLPAIHDAKVSTKRMNFANFWTDIVDSEP